MMKKAKKTYVLIISNRFPKTHKRSGEPTGFYQKIADAVIPDLPWGEETSEQKKHTLRKNYPLWKKRVEEINAGRAVLSVRCWDGEPYRSSQTEYFEFSRVGIQKIEYSPIGWIVDSFSTQLTTAELAKNDGLSLEDFQEWFKPIPKEPMAIIHFTDDLRYYASNSAINAVQKDCHRGDHYYEYWEKTGKDSGTRVHVLKKDLPTLDGQRCVFCDKPVKNESEEITVRKTYQVELETKDLEGYWMYRGYRTKKKALKVAKTLSKFFPSITTPVDVIVKEYDLLENDVCENEKIIKRFPLKNEDGEVVTAKEICRL